MKRQEAAEKKEEMGRDVKEHLAKTVHVSDVA